MLTAKAAVLASTIVVAVLFLGAGSADASTNVTVLAKSGAPGNVRVGDTTCFTNESQTSIYTSAPLVVTTQAPTVYGLSGYSQSWSTFRLSIYDLTAGRIVNTMPFAPNVAATPTTPATWSLQAQWTSTQSLNVTHRYVVLTEVWWYAGGAWRANSVMQENSYSLVTYFNQSFFQGSDTTCHNRWYSTSTNRWSDAT
jgi:hypothetical protein